MPPANGRAASSFVDAVLEGDRERFADAVAALYARRDDPESAAALARLLNLPLSEGDLRYVSLQRSLYAGLIEQAQSPEDARVARSFHLAATAAEHYQRGRTVRALSTLRRLERELEHDIEVTDDVDLHAMLGNYAHQSGAMVSLGRERRMAVAREHLEQVVMRFDELSPDAQGVTLGIPGVRPVFTIWWAQLLQRAGDPRADQAFGRAQAAVRRAEDTPAMRTLNRFATERPTTAGPLWPSGYDSCIACHSRTRATRTD